MIEQLVEAAQRERDRRERRFPAMIRAGEITAEQASITYQCWVAIAEWLETDRFQSFAGGAEPERPDAPIIRWSELEAAAGDALAKLDAGMAELPPAKITADHHAHRARVACIHRLVKLRRESIDAINAGFAASRTEIAA